MMKTIAIRIKRLLAALLVLILCCNTVLGAGITMGSHAAGEGMELLTSGARLEQADAAVISYDTVEKFGWIGGDGTTASNVQKRAYFSYPRPDTNVMVGGVAMPLTDCEVVYRVTLSDMVAVGNARSNAVAFMLRYTVDGHTYELENRFGGLIYGTGHYMQIYVDGVGKNDSTSAVTGTPFYSTANRAFNDVPALENGHTVELRVKCATATENGYIKLSLAGNQIGEFTYTGTTLPEFGLGSMKLMAKLSNISITVEGASEWASCTGDHTPGEWIVDKEADLREDGSRHTECTQCGKVLETESIPAIGGLELLTAEGKLQNPHGPSLTYDTTTKTGWIGGDGTTQDNNNAAKRYFTFPKFENVYVEGQAVSLDSCEISYLVHISEANITGNARTNAVALMLKTTDADMLELRFGAQVFGSGHYMQNVINYVGKDSVYQSNGSAFYTDDSTIKNNFPGTPALKETDTIELRVKCANDSENGYVKMYMGGQYIGELVYTGTTLPQFGLSSYKLMAKLSDISILAVGAEESSSCDQGHTPGEWIVDEEADLREDGSRHKECTQCGKVLETESIPAIGGLELLTAEGKLQNPHGPSLTYDTTTKTGWIGGDGTTQDNNNAAKRFFTFPKFEDVYVDGQTVSLDSCEISYLVNISEANITGNARTNAVALMLKTTDADMLELRFGAQVFGSGHYMQNVINYVGKDSVYQSNGSAFYTDDSTIKNNFPEAPALKETDTIELRVKCANDSENGYVKMYMGGQYIGELVYTGTTLPQFGLSSYKLMAKLSDISILAVGAARTPSCAQGHTSSDWIVDKEAGPREEGSRHTECTKCQEVLETESIPAIGGLELLTAEGKLQNPHGPSLTYDTTTKTGWIGGDGTTQDNNNAAKRYFTFPKYKNVYVDGQAVPLDSCEISYLVNISEANITGNARGNAVVLMLKTTDADMLEIRFGAQIYGSGMYMQNIISNVGKANVNQANGSAFYTADSAIINNFPDTPALKKTDTIELRVKCATETENGYVKMYVGGQYIGELVYAGKTLPEFGLSSYKLMAKLSDISILAVGAEGFVNCDQGHTPGAWVVDALPSAIQEGTQHQECSLCGATIATESIPALGGLEVLDQQASLVNAEGDRLFYDVVSKTGWTGGDGVTANATFTDRFFTFPTYSDVIINDERVALRECEISYSVTFSDFTPTGNCRGNAVGLVLQYTDSGHTYKLENRFGGQIYGSGHYMQVYVDGVGKGSVLEDTGAPFYSTTKASFADVPALKNGDTIEMRFKCASDTENGYIKLVLAGKQIGQFTYTGKTLPQLGLLSMNLMAKLTNASVRVTGATQWAGCDCSQPQVDGYSKIQDCAQGGNAYGLCVLCGNMHTKEIIAGDHQDGEWLILTEPTARGEGLRQKQCAVCSVVFEEEVIPALGGVEMFTNGSYLIDPAEDRLFYDLRTNTGWIGGDGSVKNPTYTDRYFYYPTYGKLIVDGQEKDLTDCEISYCVTFSDFTPTGNCRGNAVCLMLQYEDENGVYKLENRFGNQIYNTGHYMQLYINGTVASSVLQESGAPFFATTKGAFLDVPALKPGDTVEMRIKCASDTEDGYIKLYLQEALIGEFVFTGKTLPKLGLAAMNLMAKMTNVSVMVTGAEDWVSCQCETPKVSSYTPISDCTKGGVKYGACENCGQRHSKEVAPGYHATENWIVTDEPSTIVTGKRHKECSVCGMELYEQIMPVISGMNLIDENASFMVTEGTDASAALSYDVQTRTGWVGGNGAKANTAYLDRYFRFPQYNNVIVDEQEKPLNECEVVYSAVFSDFTPTGHCRGNAVRLMLRYTDEDGKVYILENRFGGKIYDSGHYMQVVVNNVGQGNVLQSTGAPFYGDTGASFQKAPALRNGDLVEMKVKCASGNQDGYIHVFVNGEHIGSLVYTAETLPEFGLGSMSLMAKVSDVKLTVSGASDWAHCDCETPDVKRYRVIKASNCFEDGSQEGKCVLCGNVNIQTVPAGHTASEWIVEVAAGCTTEGSRYTECAICLERIQEEVIPAKGHSSYWVQSKEAGFFTSGSKHEECMICNEVWNAQTIPPTGIAITIVVAVVMTACVVALIVVIKKARKGKQTV